MTDMTTHKRFEFGTVFGGDGRVLAEQKREKKAFTPEEVEAIRAKAYQDGENNAMARAQAAQAAAVQSLADAAQLGLSIMADAIHTHKEASVQLALVCAQKIAAEALERFPEAPLRAALDALGQEIETATRLVLYARAPDEALQAAATEAARFAGYEGAIQFRDRPAAPAGAFEVVWNEGRAEFDPQAVIDVLQVKLKEALDAEAYHRQTSAQ
jgi:flagellar assembly protein FliH